jgi:hypothetical protein
MIKIFILRTCLELEDYLQWRTYKNEAWSWASLRRSGADFSLPTKTKPWLLLFLKRCFYSVGWMTWILKLDELDWLLMPSKGPWGSCYIVPSGLSSLFSRQYGTNPSTMCYISVDLSPPSDQTDLQYVVLIASQSRLGKLLEAKQRRRLGEAGRPDY